MALPTINVKFFDKTLYMSKFTSKFIPRLASKGAAGYDLYCPFTNTIHKFATIDLKVGFEIPFGYYGRLCDKSSIAKRGLKLRCGVIDSDYRGSIKACFINLTDKPTYINQGEPIAQIIFEKCYRFELNIVDEFVITTERDIGGFGSTHPTTSTEPVQPLTHSASASMFELCDDRSDVESQFNSPDDPDDFLFSTVDISPASDDAKCCI